MRVSYNGSTSAFQVDGEVSITSTRSKEEPYSKKHLIEKVSKITIKCFIIEKIKIKVK